MLGVGSESKQKWRHRFSVSVALAIILVVAAPWATADPTGLAPLPARPSTPPGQPVPPNPPAGTKTAPTGPANGFTVEVPGPDVMRYDAATLLLVAHGNIKISYKGGTATGDKLTYDPREHVMTLEGHVVLDEEQHEYLADSIVLNTDTRLWALGNADTILLPSDVPGGDIAEPLYIHGGIFTNSSNGDLHVMNAEVTSCDHPLPTAHYWISARQITVIPGKRIILKHSSFILLRHKIFDISKLSISLEDHRYQPNQYFPMVGYDDAEGYFIKERYPFLLGSASSATLLIDLMTKKGIGLGVDDTYRLGGGTGHVHLYHIKEKDTGTEDWDATLDDARKIGDVSVNVSTNYSQDNYTETLATGSSQTTLNTNIGLTRNTAFSNTSVNFSLSDTNSTFSSTDSIGETIKQHFTFNSIFSTDLEFQRQINTYQNGSASGSTSTTTTPASGQNEYQIALNGNLPIGTAVLASDIHQPFGTSSYFVEHLPEFHFSTSSTKWFPSPPKTLRSPGQSTPANGQPAPTAGQPAATNGQSTAPTGPPAAPSGQPTPAAGQPVPATGQSTASTGPPTAPSGQPAPATGQPAVTPGQTSPTPGQTSPTPGQASATPGQASATPGQTSTIPKHPESLLDRYPLNFDLLLGRYREVNSGSFENISFDRVDFSMDTSLPPPTGHGLSLTGTAKFEQKMTSDGSAQYVTDLNLVLLKPISSHSTFNVNYSRVQPVGYTPFQFDRLGDTNIASLGFDLGFGQQAGAFTKLPSKGILGGVGTTTSPDFSSGSPGGTYGSAGGGGSLIGASSFVNPYSGYPATSPFPSTSPHSTPFVPALHLGLHTAYDFNAGQADYLGAQTWAPLSIDMYTFPTKHTVLYASSTYNLTSSAEGLSSQSPFSPVRGGIRWIGGTDRFVDIGYVWDPSSKDITTAQIHMLSKLGKLWTGEVVVGYEKSLGEGTEFNPYSGTFQQLVLVRDLHCFQANLYYSTNPQQINFSISIKAFPAVQQIGAQKFGQVSNGGFGNTY